MIKTDRAFPNQSDNQPHFDASDLIISYLQQLGVQYVFGIPGGAIEPFYNSLARSERSDGPKAIVARHETGAVFMADGYARNSGKLGVCCATSGPGATNLITGVASAYENQVPILVITGQTALRNFGRGALQDSADTGINVVGMMQFCTRYNTMVSHIDQLEYKLVSAIFTAMQPPFGPVHLSIPQDILKTPCKRALMSHSLPKWTTLTHSPSVSQLTELKKNISKNQQTVFVLGAGASKAVSCILKIAEIIDAHIVTTPDGKGLISPMHPLFRGVIGFAGHSSAGDLLRSSGVKNVVVVGSRLGEWTSNGWDQETLLSDRLIHISDNDNHLAFSPMAKLRILADIKETAQGLLELLMQSEHLIEADTTRAAATGPVEMPATEPQPHAQFEMIDVEKCDDVSLPIKPHWLMKNIVAKFPPETTYLADPGNGLAWAIHYLHPYDRRVSERRVQGRDGENRRHTDGGLFQCPMEYASMGWAIGNAPGVALANQSKPVVCITGDGSFLMSGQEITVAKQHNLNVIFIILNDSVYGMVKHGQRMASAEPIGYALPVIDYARLASAMGIHAYRVDTPEDFLSIDFDKVCKLGGPTLIDVKIDAEEVPPIGMRLKILNED